MPTLDRARVLQILAKADGAATAYDRGHQFEAVVRYAFSCVPGVKHYKSNVLNNAQSEEVDVAFFNNRLPSGLPFLEHLLLVECKNWSVPVGAIHVREFATKLKH